MSDSTDPLAWVARAEEDFALARSAIRRKVPLTYGATFHAQQGAEKYLKALLLARGQMFPRTHDLAALSDLCQLEQPEHAVPSGRVRALDSLRRSGTLSRRGPHP